MPGLDLSRNVFSAGASAATDWGSVSANANFDFSGDIQLRRGIDLDLGLAGIAQLDASFHRFLAADLSAQGEAQATLRGQVQLPLNLFDEIGLAVRLQAVAELAAGARLALGLEIGDFLALVDQDPKMQGIPARLLRVLLEEIDIGAAFYAKAAFSAEAYANIVVTGTALGDVLKGIPPGFSISAGFGAGLSAGAGFEVMANLSVRSFPRLVGRTADILIDETVNGIARALPPAAKKLGDTMLAARTPLKLAVRLTYELGAHLAQNAAGHDQAGQDAVANRVVQVCLEELQRASLEGLLRAGANELEALVETLLNSGNPWQACHNERIALADKLDAAPDDLFTPEALPFWADVAKAGAALGAKFAGTPAVIRICALLWSSAQLAGSVGNRVNQAQAHVSLIGTPPQSVVQAFSGAMPDAPPASIDQEIRTTLQAAGTNVSGSLRYEHIVVYLADRAIVDLLSKHNAPLVRFLSNLIGPVAPDLVSLVTLVLKNGGSFAAGGGTVDPARALQFFSSGIEKFVETQLTTQLRAGLDPYLQNKPDLRIAVDEILLPSLKFTVAVVFQEAANWAHSNLDSKPLTEGLSGILLGVLSRSLVVTADILLAESQKNVSNLLLGAAQQAGQPGGLATVFQGNPQIQLAAEEVLELVQDALEAGAGVFGPLPDDRRARIRNLLYTALDPLGGASPDTLLQQLNDPAMVPNLSVLQSLATELGDLACERYIQFVEALLTKIVDREVAQFQAAIAAALQAAGQWLEQLGQALAEMEARLQQLASEIQQALAAAAQRIAEITAALHQMLDSFASAQSRGTFTNQLADRVTSLALGALDSDWVYQNVVPGFLKAGIQDTVRSLTRAGISNQVVDGILAALGGLVQQIDDLVDDIRALDRTKALAPQVRNLVLSRLAALIGDRFNTVRIPIRFNVQWDVLGIKSGATIDLGEVDVDASLIAGQIRGAVQALSFFDPLINGLAVSLQGFFTAEDQAASHTAEKTGIEQEHATASSQLGAARSGPKSITIERPVALASLEGQVSIRLRLQNFDASILAQDAETPERLFVLLNGVKVDPGSLVVESQPAAVSPIAHTPAVLIPAPRSLLGSSLRIPPPVTTSIRLPTIVAAPASQLVVSGVLPVDSLRKGLNTLLVQAVVSKGTTVQAQCGFIHSGAAPQADPPPLPPTVGRTPAVLGPLPKASPPKPGAKLYLSVTERSQIAKQLGTVIRAKPVQPFARLASVSPALTQKLGLAAPPAPAAPRGTIRLVALPEDVNHG